MNTNFITILTRINLVELYLPQSLLENEGITCYIKQEVGGQVMPMYSAGIGGPMLQVQESDYEQAYKILLDAGYIKQEDEMELDFLSEQEKKWKDKPLIGRFPFSLLMMLLVFGVTFLLVLLLLYLAR